MFRDRIHLLLAVLFLPAPSHAEGLTLAVASNFARPAHEIVRRFESVTDHSVRVTTASTGKLYAQIVNGAPFDILLAADAERPRLLEASGAAVAGTRFTYAVGALTLWSRDKELTGKECKKQLTRLGSKRLAVANPLTAPYGVASRQFLEGEGLWSIAEPQLVFGENISQTLHFVVSGNASMGLIARSQALDVRLPEPTCEWPVPQAMHDPLEQQAVLLLRAATSGAATDFIAFLQSPAARKIIREHGYTVSR